MRSIVVGAVALGMVVAAFGGPALADADMRAFSKVCLKSPDLLALFQHNQVTPQVARQNYCACLGKSFGAAVNQKEADLMTAQVAGKLTSAQKQAFELDEALRTLSSTTMNQCLVTTGLKVVPAQTG